MTNEEIIKKILPFVDVHSIVMIGITDQIVWCAENNPRKRDDMWKALDLYDKGTRIFEYEANDRGGQGWYMMYQSI
jgi:hypothetical protein